MLTPPGPPPHVSGPPSTHPRIWPTPPPVRSSHSCALRNSTDAQHTSAYLTPTRLPGPPRDLSIPHMHASAPTDTSCLPLPMSCSPSPPTDAPACPPTSCLPPSYACAHSPTCLEPRDAS